MKRILLLTWRYLAFHKLKSAILLVCLTLTLFLPIALHLLIDTYNKSLGARAKATPLIAGARGDRFDLVLNTLYFRGEAPGDVSAATLDQLSAEAASGIAIPIHNAYSAKGKALVGTSLDYFVFRQLQAVRGTLPLRLGDAVVGANVAEEFGISPGDKLLTDQKSLYNIAAVYPLRLHVTGVLGRRGTPDDDAVFVDVKTAWIVAGIGHGHTDLAEPDAAGAVLENTGETIVANASLVEYQEITDANIGSFHFHAARDTLPLSSIIYVPADQKSATITRARFNASKTHQMLIPSEVVAELMGIVFQIKRFFDGSFALVLLTTILFLTLVILLSLKTREKERRTMFRIGCSKGTVFWMQAAELGILFSISLVLALILAGVTRWLAPALIGIG